LVTLAGKPLLLWQIEALSKAGIFELSVVSGYMVDKIHHFKSSFSLDFTIIENNRWSETNMLSSLLCAAQWANNDQTIISYSDILYNTYHINLLAKSICDISITYDLDWEKLWRFRNPQDPLADAETFLEANGFLKDIGGRPESLAEVKGQYMGLIKLTAAGWETWLSHCAELGESVDKIDMTSFLRRLLKKNVPIGAMPVNGAWCEVDTDQDLLLYEAALKTGGFSHDWRGKEV
jgi:choline kinase